MSFFFLMCSERSGSNFITKLLNGHNNICGPSTKHIINPLARNLFRYGDLQKEENWNELLEDVYRLITVEFSIWKVNFSFEALKELAPPGDIRALIQNIFLEEARANGKQHVFVKENHVYEFLPFLLFNFPEAKYIYMVRDPRDMSLSWKKNSDHPGGVVKAARQWKLDQQQSLKNYNLLNSQGKAYFVKYEELTANSASEVAGITKFLGLPFCEDVFNFHQDEITKKNAEKQKSWDNLSRGVISDNSRKYKDGLTNDEIKAIEKICWYEMRHLGYQSEYKEKDLSIITEDWLNRLEEEELKEIELMRSRGVKGNMSAKANFYQR